MGLAEFGSKANLCQLGLELGLNLSLEDFPGGVEEKWKYSKAQLQLGLQAVWLSLAKIRGKLVIGIPF